MSNEAIPVSDKRKPRNGEAVVVVCPNFCRSGLHIADYDVMTESYDSESEGMITAYVTHWVRLTIKKQKP